MNQNFSIMNENEKKKKRYKFSGEEDQKLKELVNLIGEDNWNEISILMKNKSPRQCRDRYRFYLSTDPINNQWNKTDEENLLILHSKIGNHWSQIADFFPGKTSASVRNHFCKLERKKQSLTINKKIIKEIKFTSINEIFKEKSKILMLPSCLNLPFPY